MPHSPTLPQPLIVMILVTRRLNTVIMSWYSGATRCCLSGGRVLASRDKFSLVSSRNCGFSYKSFYYDLYQLFYSLWDGENLVLRGKWRVGRQLELLAATISSSLACITLSAYQCTYQTQNKHLLFSIFVSNTYWRTPHRHKLELGWFDLMFAMGPSIGLHSHPE